MNTSTVQLAEKGFSPLSEQLLVSDLHWSEGVARQAVWLSGKVPFGDVAEIMEELGQVPISKSSVWRLSQKWGEIFRTEREKEQELESLPVHQDALCPGKRMGVSMDGFMVHVLEEGWKEVKAGCLFEVGKEQVLDKETLTTEEVGRAIQVSHVAHLGGPEIFGKHLWGEALRRNWQRASETQIIGDGARWIWNLAEQYYYKSYALVDWYHAVEHLAKSGEVFYGADISSRQSWLKKQKKALFQENTLEVIISLKEKVKRKRGITRKKLLQEVSFFENNKGRMNYRSLRNEGWLMGSGVIESGAKQYKARFTGSGMRWKRSSLERMLHLRAAIMSNNFNQTWKALYSLPTN